MALSALQRDPASGGRFASAVPGPCRARPCALGVDEAGRGPVLGPMVYAVCYCPEDKLQELEALGWQTRRRCRRRSGSGASGSWRPRGIGWGGRCRCCPPPTSRPACSSAKYNLNELSHDTATELIQFVLDSGVQVAQVFVDTVGPADKYEAKLRRRFPGLGVTVRPKADALFPAVSAASICAKVARDRAVLHWNFVEDLGDPDRDYGSGYPNDPKTKEWLRRNLEPVFGFPQLVRFSWGTAQALLQREGVPVQWYRGADEDPPEDPSAPPSVLSYFARSPPRRPPHRFFQERSLRPLAEL